MPKPTTELAPDQRQKLRDFHAVFDVSEEGKRVLRDLRAEVYDVPSATQRMANGSRVLLNHDEVYFIGGQRAVFELILGYLEAYDRMSKEA